MSGSVFSESWHRVAGIHVGLASKVEVHKQLFRGRQWYVLKDPFNNRFSRITPEAYNFVMRLTPEKTVEQVWEHCLELFPSTAPGQEEVIQLLSQLQAANLLYFKNAPDSQRIFERYQKQQRRELRGKLLSFLFIRIPLWNPESLLRKIEPFIRMVFSVFGAIVWLLVILLGANAVAENFSSVAEQTQGLLAPGNLIWLYLALVFLKLVHEAGHALMCKRFGGEVHTMGVMLLIFTPLPYMDASSSWGFRNRWHRALVGAAGMITELFIAALAALVWAKTGEGTLHSLAFNMMVIGSISSLLFNGNPLLRFDAYFILSDVLEIPNLYQRAQKQWIHWIEKYLFRSINLVPPAYSRVEAFWLASYGALSTVYRLLVVLAITLFVADQWFLLGILMAIISISIWIIKPIIDIIRYLFVSTKLGRNRPWAQFLTLSALSMLLLVLTVIPFPHSIRAPGIIESEHFTNVYTSTAGYLERIRVESGRSVEKGDVLIEFINTELDLDIRTTRYQILETQALVSQARNRIIADIAPARARLSLLKEKLAGLEQRREELTVRASSSGVWIAPELSRHRNTWFKRRAELGVIVASDAYNFTAVVSQEQASDLFGFDNLSGEVRLWGRTNQPITAPEIQVIPYERWVLPSAVLGWSGGGDIAVVSTEDGKTTTEAFFEVSAKFQDDIEGMTLYHGSSGILQISLPPKPLIQKWYMTIEQVLQKRYRL
jgi:putative peptide zinc metalloprotease protein